MKKTISIILTVALLFSVATYYCTTAVSGYMFKDANMDSAFNAKDVLIVKQYLAQWKVEIDLVAADLNFDETVNAKDVLLMRKCLADIIDITEPTTIAPTTTQAAPTTTSDPKKCIALTFDDGPNTYATPNILRQLRRYGAKATFFLIGSYINDDNASVVKQAFDQGCEIANHSFSHVRMNEMSVDEIKTEIDKTDELIYNIIGQKTKFFRSPFLVSTETMYDTIDKTFIAGIGADDYMTSVEDTDVIETLKSTVSAGTIILLHDSQGKNENVVQSIVPYFQKQGYDFVTLSEMFERYGVKSQKGITYTLL